MQTDWLSGNLDVLGPPHDAGNQTAFEPSNMRPPHLQSGSSVCCRGVQWGLEGDVEEIVALARNGAMQQTREPGAVEKLGIFFPLGDLLDVVIAAMRDSPEFEKQPLKILIARIDWPHMLVVFGWRHSHGQDFSR